MTTQTKPDQVIRIHESKMNDEVRLALLWKAFEEAEERIRELERENDAARAARGAPQGMPQSTEDRARLHAQAEADRTRLQAEVDRLQRIVDALQVETTDLKRVGAAERARLAQAAEHARHIAEEREQEIRRKDAQIRSIKENAELERVRLTKAASEAHAEAAAREGTSRTEHTRLAREAADAQAKAARIEGAARADQMRLTQEIAHARAEAASLDKDLQDKDAQLRKLAEAEATRERLVADLDESRRSAAERAAELERSEAAREGALEQGARAIENAKAHKARAEQAVAWARAQRERDTRAVARALDLSNARAQHVAREREALQLEISDARAAREQAEASLAHARDAASAREVERNEAWAARDAARRDLSSRPSAPTGVTIGASRTYPVGNDHVDALPGIRAEEAAAFRGVGMNFADTLLYADLGRLKEATGVPVVRLAKLRSFAELMGLRGVGPEWAGRLYKAGFRGIDDVAHSTPEVVFRALTTGYWRQNARELLARTLPRQCESIVRQARAAASEASWTSVGPKA